MSILAFFHVILPLPVTTRTMMRRGAIVEFDDCRGAVLSLCGFAHNFSECPQVTLLLSDAFKWERTATGTPHF